MPKIVWGTINADGSVVDGSDDFSVSVQGSGQYVISFSPTFSGTPAVVGSQTRFGNLGEWPSDTLCFPFVSGGSVTAITGSGSNPGNRNFSFIAIGN